MLGLSLSVVYCVSLVLFGFNMPSCCSPKKCAEHSSLSSMGGLTAQPSVSVRATYWCSLGGCGAYWPKRNNRENDSVCICGGRGGHLNVLSGQAQWPISCNFRVPSDELRGTLRERAETITQCSVLGTLTRCFMQDPSWARPSPGGGLSIYIRMQPRRSKVKVLECVNTELQAFWSWYRVLLLPGAQYQEVPKNHITVCVWGPGASTPVKVKTESCGPFCM